jgi:hypothetical protein
MRLKITIIAIMAAAFVALGIVYFQSSDETLGNAPPAATASASKAVTEDQIVRAYVELATLAETTPIGTPEYDLEKTRVLGQIGLEPGQIEKTLAEYNERPEKWRPIWDRIQSELAKRNALPEDTSATVQDAKRPL